MLYAINFSAPLNAASGDVTVGSVVCKASDGASYVVANDANMAVIGGVPNGVAITSGNGTLGPNSIVVLVGGTLSASVTGIGTDTTWRYAVRSSSGGISRVTTPNVGDDVLGIVNPNGDVVLTPPTKWGSGSSGGLPVLPSDGFYGLIVAGNVGTWSAITEDDVLPGFAPTLSFATGGTSPVEVSATDNITPTFNGNPAPNAAGVTAYTISDSQGGGPTSRLGSANGFQGPAVSYHSTSPATLTFTASVTKGGVTKSATASIAIYNRMFGIGVITGSGVTAITAGGTGCTVSGGTASGTLTGSLVSTPVGQSASPNPTSQKLVFACAHTSGSHVVHDANGDLIPFTKTVSAYSFTTVTGVVGVSMDIYESDNLLTTLALPLTIVS